MIPSHFSQDLSISWLSRDVNLRTDIWSFSNDVKYSIRKIFRMRTCESESHLRSYQRNSIKQISKSSCIASSQFKHLFESISVLMIRTFSLFINIGVDILTQESNFFKPFISQHFDLILNACNSSWSFSSSCERNNTKRTHVVTPSHDTHPSRYFIRISSHRLYISIGLILA